MKKWRRVLVGGALILAIATVALWIQHRGAAFQNLRSAQARVASLGYHCTSDVRTGEIVSGFVVSRDKTEWSDCVELRKSGPMGSQWKGKVWVTRNTEVVQLQTMPDDAETRVWGDVIAFGDSELLDELDEALDEPFELF